MNLPKPSRGEVWFLNLDPTQDHGQTSSRPALVISVDAFNHARGGPASHLQGQKHPPLIPPAGGIRQPSFVKYEDVLVSLARGSGSVGEWWLPIPWQLSKTVCGY